jgi:hypothetical protein
MIINSIFIKIYVRLKLQVKEDRRRIFLVITSAQIVVSSGPGTAEYLEQWNRKYHEEYTF